MRHPPAAPADLLPAAAVLVIGLQEAIVPLGSGFSRAGGPRAALVVQIVLVATALLWRRHRPLLTALAVNATLATHALAFGSPDGLAEIVPVGIALYSVGRHGDIAALLIAAAASAGNGVVHGWRDTQSLPLGPQLTMWMTILAAGLAGRFITATARTSASYARRAEAAEQERDERMRAAAAAERVRIAHELHDLVGHGISVVVLQAVGAQAALEQGDVPAATARLARLETSARDTMEEMRRLLRVLGEDDGQLTPQPGVGDIGHLVETLTAAGVAVDLRVDTAGAEIPTGIGLAAFRVVQEGLTNVVRHAGRGVAARVMVVARDGLLDVEVRDPGTSRPASFVAGRGIAGMRERVALYGGTLHVGPQDGGGFLVRAQLPLASRSA